MWLKIRKQASLTYVRKELAAGLLGTCHQVYKEAAMYFWSDNLFRFPGRSGWQGLLRFLLTIGPAARSHIKRLDVHAPMYMRWPNKADDDRDLNGYSKNWPKMHMVKIPPEDHTDHAAAQRVCTILAQERTLEEINFVVPASFRNGDMQEYGGYNDGGCTCYSQTPLKKIAELDFLHKTVVVEEGGYLAVEKGPEQIMDEGWDLVCEPGSYIYEKKPGEAFYLKHKVDEKCMWKSPAREWDYLLGLSTLFPLPDEPAECHANGGKHKKKKVSPLGRELKAFGGCKFVYDRGGIRLSSKWCAEPGEWDYLIGVRWLFQEESAITKTLREEIAKQTSLESENLENGDWKDGGLKDGGLRDSKRKKGWSKMGKYMN